MPIEARTNLLNNLSAKLLSEVSNDEMIRVMDIVSTQLASYDLNQIEEDDAPDNLLDIYLTTMEIEGRSERTIERYRYAITRMMKSVSVPTNKITVHHLRKYLADEKARGICDNTLEGNREIFCAYFNWLQREGLIQSNPTANLGAIKAPKRMKHIYTEVDIEKLKMACKTIRDKAIICFLLSTGCRITEMIQLNRSDIDLSKLECRVIGKGDKERIVYMDPIAGMLLEEYLKSRTDDMPALFIGKGTNRLTPAGVRFMLNKVADEAGVVHVHPHKFRRTLATSLIRHGMPIQEVAHILGHEKLDTTMKYVVMDQTGVAQSYRKYT